MTSGNGPRADAAPAPPLRAGVAVLLIVALAFALRVVYVLQTRASPLFDRPQMDALYHVQWAQAFARGEDFQPGPFFRAPLYPWFLGLLFRLFGDGLLLPRLVQAGLGAATTFLTWRIGARAFDRRVGLLAAALAATSWILVFYDGELLLETLAIPLNLLAVDLSFDAARERKPARCALAGAAYGLAASARPNILLVAVLFGAWLLWRGRGAGARAWAAPALLALGALAPIAPLTVYNRVVGKDAVLISSQAGVNLWIGNNPRSDGASALVPGTREDWWGGYQDSIRMAEHDEGRTLRPSEVSAYFTRKALGFWSAEPLAALRLTLRKVRLLWLDWELGNNEEPRFFAERFGPVTRFLPVTFGVLAAFGTLGLLASLRGGAARAPLLIFVVGYAATVVVFFVCSRYRAPLIPALCVYGAYATFWLARCARARRFGALALAALVLAASATASWTRPRGMVTSEANGLYLLGMVEGNAGRTESAAELLGRALAIEPDNYIVQREYARALRLLGRNPEAEAAFRRALQHTPDDVSSLDGLGDLLLEQNRADEARRLAEQAIAGAPFDARGYYLLGRVQVAGNAYADAERSFAASLEREPASFRSAYALGMSRLAQASPERAREAFERAVAATALPGEARFARDAWQRLIGILEAQGARDEALRRAREASARWPDDAELRALAARLAQ